MAFGGAIDLIGEIFAFGITLKMLDKIDGVPHKVEKTFRYKESAQEYEERLKKRGYKTKLITKKDQYGHPFYIIYTRVETKTKKKKK